jgi:putative ABC transport system permease protein
MLANVTLAMALTVLVRNKGRSALTILGLTIGVAAFIAVVSFGVGARTAVLTQFEGLGVNMLRIGIRSLTGNKGKPGHFLTEDDVEMLRGESSAFSLIVPTVLRTGVFGHGAARMRGALLATTPEYATLRGLQFADGGMFDSDADRSAKKVCVLGAGTAQQLFDSGAETRAVGATLTIGARFVCHVIGVVARRVGASSSPEVNDFVLIPSRTYQEHIERTHYSYIDVRPSEPELREVARAEVDAIMRRSHQFKPEDDADFNIASPDDATRAADRTAKLLTGLLAAIAGVSLLVGGIGIMNLQLVAVSERAQEIGIRAAIGAAPAQIRQQFLVESSLLSSVGTLAGVVLGVVISKIVALNMGWAYANPAWVAVSAGLFGMLIGVAFGYVPAARAARLDPIQALRLE